MPSAEKLERVVDVPVPEDVACAVATTRPIRKMLFIVTDSTVDAASATTTPEESTFEVAFETALPIAFPPESEPVAVACPAEEPDVLSALRLSAGWSTFCEGCPGYCEDTARGYAGRLGGRSPSCGSSSDVTSPGAPTITSPG
jgi:hypothetical protein